MYQQGYPWSCSSAKEATYLIGWCFDYFRCPLFLNSFLETKVEILDWIFISLPLLCLVEGRDRNGLNFPSWFLFCPWLSHLSALISIYGEWLYWDATVWFDPGCVLWLAVFFLLLTNLYWSFIQLHSVSAWKSYWRFRQIWVVLLCVLIAPFSYPLIECNDWVTYISPSKFHLL